MCIQQWPNGHLFGVRRQRARSGLALLGTGTHRRTANLASHLPACRWMGGRVTSAALLSRTTSMPTATGPGVLCERRCGAEGKAKRTLRALPASCFSWPPTQAGRQELRRSPESRRGQHHHAVGKPRSPRECRDAGMWLLCFVGEESTSADKYEIIQIWGISSLGKARE